MPAAAGSVANTAQFFLPAGATRVVSRFPIC
jgi:hypothetical protein